jgi:hypothetical protein
MSGEYIYKMQGFVICQLKPFNDGVFARGYYMGDGVMHPHWGSLVYEQGKIRRVSYELAKKKTTKLP